MLGRFRSDSFSFFFNMQKRRQMILALEPIIVSNYTSMCVFVEYLIKI